MVLDDSPMKKESGEAFSEFAAVLSGAMGITFMSASCLATQISPLWRPFCLLPMFFLHFCTASTSTSSVFYFQEIKKDAYASCSQPGFAHGASYSIAKKRFPT